VPPLLEHSLEVLADSEMRCAYLDGDLSDRVRGRCSVVAITPLLRELILYVAESTPPLEEAIESSLGTLISAIVDKALRQRLKSLHQKNPAFLRSFANWSKARVTTEPARNGLTPLAPRRDRCVAISRRKPE
jgi:hypothetical protein